MYVHNYYSDLLSNLYRFLNSYVLSDHNKVRSIRYNIEDVSSAMLYNDSEKRPSMVILLDSLESDDSQPLHPRSFQANTNVIDTGMDTLPVVYNNTKGIGFFFQTTPYKLTINVNIKCETQSQALNIKHDILTKIPINKLIEFKKLEFVSFFELDSSYLVPSVFDILNDDITNLFLRQDETGNLGRYFPVSFQPLIRMPSSPSLAIDDETAGSFMISINFEMNIKEPTKLITDDVRLNNVLKSKSSIKSDSLTTITRGEVTVPVYEGYIHTLIYNSGYKVYSFNPSKLSNKYTDIDGTIISGSYIGDNIEFETTQYVGRMFKYSTGQVITILDNGDYIADAKIANNILTGKLSDDTVVTENIQWVSTFPIVTTLKESKGLPIRAINIADLYSVDPTIPPYRTTIDLGLSKITKISIIRISTESIIEEIVDVAFLPDGNFSATLTFENISISGKLDRNTGQFTNIYIDNLNFAVFNITINPTYNFNAYGTNIIESVSFDITEFKPSIHPTMLNYTTILNGAIRENVDFLVLLSSISYSPIVNNPNHFRFILTIDQNAFVLSVTPPNFNLFLIHDNHNFSNNVAVNWGLSTPTFITIDCNESIKTLILDNVSNSKPLYVGLKCITP